MDIFWNKHKYLHQQINLIHVILLSIFFSIIFSFNDDSACGMTNIWFAVMPSIVHELFPRSRISCKWMRTNLYRIWSRLEWSRHDPPEDRQLIHTVLKDRGNVDSIRSTQHPCRWNDQNNLLVQRYAWIYAFNLSNNFLINQ